MPAPDPIPGGLRLLPSSSGPPHFSVIAPDGGMLDFSVPSLCVFSASPALPSGPCTLVRKDATGEHWDCSAWFTRWPDGVYGIRVFRGLAVYKDPRLNTITVRGGVVVARMTDGLGGSGTPAPALMLVGDPSCRFPRRRPKRGPR